MPGGIVLIDEPAHVNVTTFARDGTMLLTFNARRGGDCGQVIVGMTARQALQLIARLEANAAYCRQAVSEGRGGVSFPAEADQHPGS